MTPEVQQMSEHTARKIFRWEISVTDEETDIIAPPIQSILRVTATSDSTLEFWGIVDSEAEPVEQGFTVVGTGHLIYGDGWEYVGTTQRTSSGLVWHLLRHSAEGAADGD